MIFPGSVCVVSHVVLGGIVQLTGPTILHLAKLFKAVTKIKTVKCFGRVLP